MARHLYHACLSIKPSEATDADLLQPLEQIIFINTNYNTQHLTKSQVSHQATGFRGDRAIFLLSHMSLLGDIKIYTLVFTWAYKGL